MIGSTSGGTPLTTSTTLTRTTSSDATDAAIKQASYLGTTNQSYTAPSGGGTPSPTVTTTSTPTTTTTATSAPTRTMTEAELASIYAIPLAVIQSDPELKKLFDEAWAAQKAGMEWSQQYFTVRLQSTTWYKTKSEAERKYYVLSTDPAQAAEFQKQVDATKARLGDFAGALGVSLSSSEMGQLTTSALKYGLNDSELRNTLATYISYQGKTDAEIIGSLFGEAGNYEDQIRNWAKANGVTIANDWVLNQVKGIVAGDFDTNKAKDYITNIAKLQYGAWASRLDNATSVLDLAAGYRQAIANELNQSYEMVDLSNKYLNTAMTSAGPDGQPVSIDALRETLRKTDEWANVDKNKDSVVGVANEILSRFGMM